MNDRDPRPGESVPARQLRHACSPVTSYPEIQVAGNPNPVHLLPQDLTPEVLRDWNARAWNVPVENLPLDLFGDDGQPLSPAAFEGTV